MIDFEKPITKNREYNRKFIQYFMVVSIKLYQRKMVIGLLHISLVFYSNHITANKKLL